MDINQRIKDLRKNLGLNQKDFGIKLGMSQGAISWMEQSGNTIIDQNKRIICDTFHVSMRWLETGEGEMYTSDAPSDIFDSMREELNLSIVEENILRKYFQLEAGSRQAVADFIVSIGKAAVEPSQPSVDPIQQELADYEAELRAQQQDASVSVTGAEPTKNRA